MNECQITKNQSMSSVISEIYLFNCNNTKSENTIQASRVNEHLCFEFERGRAHGEGFINDGKYIFNESKTWLNLHKACVWHPPRKYDSLLDFYSRGGEPLINEHCDVGWPPIMNGTFLWNTQWPYLRASVYSSSVGAVTDLLGVTASEWQQVQALGDKWGLSGKWGDKNLLAEGNWHYDDSLLTTYADTNAAYFLICDSKGVPQYPIELFSTDEGTLILPYRYLKRKRFYGARRVFFAPEKDIEIWGIQSIAQPHITDFILCFDPGMLLFYPNGIETTAFGCILGGANAVVKSNFLPLRGKRGGVMLVNPSDKEEIEFVVKTTAELRKNRINFSCVQMTGDYNLRDFSISNVQKTFQGTILTNLQALELTIPKLRKLAIKNNIPIPEELYDDYLGDITECINVHEDEPVVSGLFNLGEVVILNVKDEIITPILTAHFARSFASGVDLFSKLWMNKKFMTTVFVNDVADENARYLRASAVKICDIRFIEAKPEERLKNFRNIMGPSKIVIFAASRLWKHPEIFQEIIRWCRTHNITAIVLSNSEKSTTKNCLECLHGTSIIVDRIDGDNEINIALKAEGIAAVEASFSSNGLLLSCKQLSDAKSKQVVQGNTLQSRPYDNSRLNELNALPPEQKLEKLQKFIE